MALSWTHSPAVAAGRSIPDDPTAIDALALEATPAFERLAHRIRSEYHEMPGLNVTREQARCLWALDPEVCDRLLAHLVRTGFLVRTTQHTYVRAS